MYEGCFGMQVSDHNGKWIPNVVCGACNTMIYRWRTEKQKIPVRFRKLMIWRKPQHCKECYICLTDLTAINGKNRDTVVYAEVSIVTKSIQASRSSNPVEISIQSKVDDDDEAEVCEYDDDDDKVSDDNDDLNDDDGDNGENSENSTDEDVVPS